MNNLGNGLMLALAGALLLTPDTLLMRLSGLDGGAMLAWRACLAGLVFLSIGLIARFKEEKGNRARVSSFGFWSLVICQIGNASFFAFGIALAPVAVVLLAVATVPVIAALLGYFLLGELADRRVWATIVLVFSGILMSVAGDIERGMNIDFETLLGACCGLAVAISLAFNFVIIRKNKTVPFELAIGLGALIAGCTAFYLWPAAWQVRGASLIYISVTGLIILPVSFFLLSKASRLTSAANVSMIMLLETVLGPLWVWRGIKETPNSLTLLGGVLVVGALGFFLYRQAGEPALERAGK
ncbi:EamA-like transporter family protein [Rhodobacteraceae bacterium SB2]|jgi:drug/metabolite transporter (DMT)-like permease|nr:DMT family transporter [Paracoccaceae bacterium]OAH08888.1 EamA-like transporter family protein [Rhodobacteraceae bacterium SB2]